MSHIVSAVITLRNRGQQFRNCFHSIVTNAEVRPNQIVVVDDRSDDGETKQILYDLALRASMLGVSMKVKHRTGEPGWRSPSVPRNVAIRNTREDADLVFFLEPESLCFPNTLKIMLERYDKEEKPCWVNAVQQGFVLRPISSDEAANPEWVWWQNFVHRDPLPHIAIRCAIVPREDVFRLQGYDEWYENGLTDREGRTTNMYAFDDVDFATRLRIAKVRAIDDFGIRILHQWHEPAPANGDPGAANHDHMQMNERLNVTAPNDPLTWGSDNGQFPIPA